MKQNKLVLTVLTLVISVCLACSLAACISDYECTQHEWCSTVVLTAPTCTTKGVQEQKCKWCYEKQTVEIAALDHLFSEDWSADENGHYHACTRDNCTEKADQATHLDDDKDHKCDICLETCSICVDSDADGKCDICGNNMSVCKDDDNDHLCDDCGDKLSDCTDENKNHKCDVCGADMGEHKAAEDSHICDYCNQPASDHTGGTATCTEQATCTVCGEKYGNALGHNSDGSIDHKDADCTNDGVVGGTYCTRCNDGKAAAEATIDALGHDNKGSIDHKDADCTNDGVVGGTYCTRCNDGKADAEATIPAKGHSFTQEKAEDKYLKSIATETSPAIYYKSCANCGKSSQGEVGEATFESGSAIVHKYTAETVEDKYLKSAATCTSPAIYYKSCADCGKSSQGEAGEATFESGNATAHDYGDITYAWNNDYTAFIATRTCSNCADGVEGHTQTATSVDWAIYYITTEPTCTEAGVAGYLVTFDVDWIDERPTVFGWYPKNGHKFTLKKHDATYHWKECSVCFEIEESSKGTHTYDQPVVHNNYLATPATCITKATYYYTCTCGAKGTETFEDSHYAKHTFSDDAWQDEVPATCINTGIKGHKDCTVCKQHFDISGNKIEDLTIKIDSNGHNYVNNVCTYCEEKHPSLVFYLVGYINGEDCGVESDAQNTGNHKFDDNGKLTVDFTTASYVLVKKGDNSVWYMADGDIGQDQRNIILYPTEELGENARQLFIPANTKATFIIEESNVAISISFTFDCLVHNLTEHTAKDSTCIADGNVAYWSCSSCSNYFANAQGSALIADANKDGKITLADTVIAKLGHNYGTVSYVWDDDKDECTATRSCSVCAENVEGHTQTAFANVTNQITQNATCVLVELSTKTATFNEDWAETQTVTDFQTKPALGHIDENKDHVCDRDGCTESMGTHQAAENSHVCDYCNQTASDHTGGTATCQTQATCTVCSEKYGNLGEHDLEWVKSAEGHYRQCKTENCTEKEKLEEHNFKEGVCKTCDDKDIYGTEGLLYEYNAQTQTYTVIGFDLDVIDYWTWDLTVKIPYYYNDGTNGVKVVGGIGEWAFADPDDPYYYEDIDAITVPNGITFVGDHAFDNLTITYTELNDNSYLGSADNPYTVLVKGSSQTDLTVNAKIIYYRAFYDGTIHTVTLGKDVIYIGTEAFSYNYIDTVFNESSLNIVKGSTDHGSVAEDADNVYTSGKVGDFTLWLGDLEDIVTSYNGNSSSVVLPDYFTEGNTYSVGEDAFEYNTTITSVYFGTGVTSIGVSAFRLAEALKTVTFADNCLLEQIGGYAFASCSSLESISFGKNSKLKIIEYNAFAGGCSALREIDIPDSVTSIQDYAFLYATGLTKVNFGENSQLSTIGISAFGNATSLVSFTLPATVTFIGNYAFDGCYKLFEVINLSSLNLEKGTDTNGSLAEYAKVIKGAGDSSSIVYREDGYIFFTHSETDSVTSQTITTNYLMGYFGTQTALTLPADYNGSAYEFAPYVFASNESIKSVVVTQGNISDHAFWNCTSLQSVTFASGYSGEIIGQYAFVGTAIQHIIIPASITVIKGRAFNAWSYKNLLKTVDFEDNSNLTTIESRAFVECYDLVSFTLPANVNSIANDAFSGCTSLMEVINLSSLNIQAGSGDYGEIAKYATVVLSSREDATLPDENGYRFITANGINYLMFYIGTQTQLTLPESYNGEQYEIAKNAFKNNKNLTSVVIPKNVTAIGDSAFEDCSLLKTVTFEADSALLTIGANAFKNCAIQAIAIPKSVTTIGDYAFFCCESLKTVTFEADSALLTIGANAFEYCAIQAIAIPKSVTTIGDYAFSCCESLKTVTFEEGINLESLDQGIFYYCALISITIPKSVKNIGAGAFMKCSALETVTMEEGSMLQTIGDGAFWNCYALKTINIPDSVTFIDIDVFGGCSNLTYTKYEGAYYLGNTTNPYVVLVKAANTYLNSCTIHENTKIIYQSAFENCSNLREVEIPDGVACIGQKAFYNCGINYVSCYSSVTYIGENAFATDDGEVYVNLSYYGTQEQWDAIKKGEYGNIFNRYYDVGIYG